MIPNKIQEIQPRVVTTYCGKGCVVLEWHPIQFLCALEGPWEEHDVCPDWGDAPEEEDERRPP